MFTHDQIRGYVGNNARATAPVAVRATPDDRNVIKRLDKGSESTRNGPSWILEASEA
jgi:hypothetical protein